MRKIFIDEIQTSIAKHLYAFSYFFPLTQTHLSTEQTHLSTENHSISLRIVYTDIMQSLDCANRWNRNILYIIEINISPRFYY